MVREETAPADPAQPWVQFPQVAPRCRRSIAVAAMLVVAVPVAGLVAASGRSWSGVAVAALVAWWWTRRPRRDSTSLVLAVGSAVLVGVLAGRPAAWSLVVSLIALGAVVVPVADDERSDVSSIEPIVGLALLAGVLAWRGVEPTVTLAVQAMSVLVALVGLLRGATLARVTRWLHRAAHAVGVVLGRALFALLGVVFVLLPWALTRCVGWDPTWSRRADGSRLVPLDRMPLDVDQQWRMRPDLLPVGVRRRLHALSMVVPVLLIVLMVGLVLWWRWAPAPEGSDSAALAGSAWWSEARQAQLGTFDDATLRGFEGPVLSDVRSKYTNVVDGRRRTWAPPDGELTVWFFGGSAAFGLGQRDDHTIASELARVAERAGLSLDVVNFGVHGDVQWMELNRLRAELARGADRPDLVVFYDGFNELATFDYLRNAGRWSDQPFVGSEDSTGITRVPEGLWRWMPAVLSSPDTPTTGDAPQSDGEVVESAASQYRESVAVTRAALAALQVPAVFVYQPSRSTRSTPVAAEGRDGDSARRMERAFRSSLPSDVIDLSGAFDEIGQPVYWDAVHTNELGARVVATKLWKRLSPELRSLGSGS